MEHSPLGSILGSLLAVLGLVLANAFFVSAEFALVGARRTRLGEMAKAGDRKAMVAQRVLQSLARYISATQLGITICSLGLGRIGEPAMADLILRVFKGLPPTIGPVDTRALASVIAFAVIAYTLLIVGELVPKALALLYPEILASWLAPPLVAFAWVMAPPIRFLNWTANLLLRLIRIKPPASHERLHSPE